MELMVGGSLSSVMKEFGCLEEKLIRKYTRQLVEAISHIHRLNILHRDIKCSNILTDVKGNVKLADFGCARTLWKVIESDLFEEE
jgi:serine/threonine protein kinase